MEAAGRRHVRFGFALVAVLSLTQALSATAGPDAGTGADAGSSPSTAIELPAFGAYDGFGAGEDRDWYHAVGDGSAGCVRAKLTSEESRRMTLATTYNARYGVLREDSPTGSAGAPGTLAILMTTSELRSVYVGFETRNDSAERADAYVFSVRYRAPIPVESLGVNLDRTGDCYSGTLSGNGATVTRFFQATAGEVLLTSLTGPGVELRVLDPVGNVVAELHDGDVANLLLGSTGTYSMQSSSTGPASFIAAAALVEDPNPTQPCRPTCFLA